MNDTIMASLAAARCRKKPEMPASNAGLRAARKIAERFPIKSNPLSDIPKVSGPRTTVTVSLDSEIVKRIKAESGDPSAKIRDILRNHFKPKV